MLARPLKRALRLARAVSGSVRSLSHGIGKTTEFARDEPARTGPLRIGVFKGDGTGPEVTDEALKVLAEVAKIDGVKYTTNELPFSNASQRFQKGATKARKFQMWQQAKFGAAAGTAGTVGVGGVTIPPYKLVMVSVVRVVAVARDAPLRAQSSAGVPRIPPRELPFKPLHAGVQQFRAVGNLVATLPRHKVGVVGPVERRERDPVLSHREARG